MIVTCKQCGTRFKLDSNLVKPSGSNVRCSGCKSVFRVYPPSLGEELAPPAGPGAAVSSVSMASGFSDDSDSAADNHLEAGKGGIAYEGSQTEAVPVDALKDDNLGLDEPEFEEIERMLGISAESVENSQVEKPAESSPLSTSAVSAVEDENEPLMLDLSALEVGPNVEGGQDSAGKPVAPEFGSEDIFDLDPSDLEIEVVDSSAPSPVEKPPVEIDSSEFESFEAEDAPRPDEMAVAEEEDISGAEDIDSGDMEDILRSMDLEDAPIDEEIADVDFESFDLLSGDTSPGEDMEDAVTDLPLDESHEDLDPTEIEALLDMELAPDSAEEFEAAQGVTGNIDSPDDTDLLMEVDESATEVFEEELIGMGTSETESELVFDSDTESAAEVGTGPSAAIEAADEGNLDLDQLERMIAGEEAFLSDPSHETADVPVTASSASPAIEKEKETEAAGRDSSEAADTFDEVDLADIELLLDREIAAEAAGEEKAYVGEELDDLDLDLELDLEEEDIAVQTEGDKVDGAVFGLTDLEQMLTEEMDDHDVEPAEKEQLLETAAAAAGEQTQGEADGEDAFDFSDIEKLLDEDVQAPSGFEETDEEELVLELDLAPINESPDADDKAEAFIETPESAEIDDVVAPNADLEELDLGLEDIPAEFAGASVIFEGEDGLELETLTSFGEKETVASKTIDRLKDEPYQPVEFDAKVFEVGSQDDDILLANEIDRESNIGAVVVPKPRKKKARTSLVVLLILALIGGGGYGLYTLLDQKNISIPFVDRFFNKVPVDAGGLLISMTGVKNRFITNSKAGLLFIITGLAKNGYDHPRSYIQIKGALKTQRGRTVKIQKAYCGNVIADKDLKTRDLAAINLRMSNRAGSNRSNIKVAAGRTVPFMLVFSDLPPALGEFTLEPAKSAPAK